jgi:hypothetical protein
MASRIMSAIVSRWSGSAPSAANSLMAKIAEERRPSAKRVLLPLRNAFFMAAKVFRSRGLAFQRHSETNAYIQGLRTAAQIREKDAHTSISVINGDMGWSISERLTH